MGDFFLGVSTLYFPVIIGIPFYRSLAEALKNTIFSPTCQFAHLRPRYDVIAREHLLQAGYDRSNLTTNQAKEIATLSRKAGIARNDE